MHHTSFPFLHDYDVKCLISRFMEDVNKQRRNFISASELGSIWSLEIQFQQGSPTFDKRDFKIQRRDGDKNVV